MMLVGRLMADLNRGALLVIGPRLDDVGGVVSSTGFKDGRG
jgi:hypothetical protein